MDLQGNTFWEFHDALSHDKHRMRRIVRYPRETHYSEVKISPQWHQWLRHTRREPPSLVEQSQDLVRQQNLKVLAAQADARWAAKPSFLDAPQRSQSLPALDPGGAEKLEGGDEPVLAEARKSATEEIGSAKERRTPGRTFDEKPKQEQRRLKDENEKKDDPWKNARGGPSEEWQPQQWTGNVAARR